jgi:hypothetical protein
MMKKKLTLFLFIQILLTTAVVAQDLSQDLSKNIEWNVDMFGFADNREYRGTVQIPQSMMGSRVAPGIGIVWDEYNHIRIGVDGLHEFGSNNGIDNLTYTAYYLYDWKPFKLYFGDFPRKYALSNFPKAFFYDSLMYYRPNINGLFWQYEKKQNNFSVFLDWTSRQTDTRRETFIIGASGYYQKGVFFAEFQDYMSHHAGTAIWDPNDHIHDNGLFHADLGLDFREQTGLDTLYINAGVLQGEERRRGDESTGWQTPTGVMIEGNISWQGFGIKNTFYSGQGLMVYYKTPDNTQQLYWGDPFYQAKLYNRTDLSWHLIKSNRVNASFILSFHYVQNIISQQQQFLVTINLDNTKKDNKVERYFWNNWLH